MYLYKTKRFIPDYPKAKSLNLKSEDFDYWVFYNSVIKRYAKEGLSLSAYNDNYLSFIFLPKNALNSPLEYFLNCFVHKKGEVISTIDELDFSYRKLFFGIIYKAIRSLHKVSCQDKFKLRRIYGIQHIGLDELGNHLFSTTYEHMHWHIYGVTDKILSKSDYILKPELYFREPNVLREWLILEYFNLFKSRFPQIKLDIHTNSIILLEKPLSFELSDDEIHMLTDTICYWKKIWISFAECFTNFTPSKQNRYTLFKKEERVLRIDALCNELGLIDNKKFIFLANKIREYFVDNPLNKSYWNTLHKNINGSFGITFDFDSNTTTFRLAPRTFALKERIGATDGFFFCSKNREKYLEPSTHKEFVDTQKKLIKYLQVEK